MNTNPINNNVWVVPVGSTVMATRSIEPVLPYTNDIPNNNIPDANAPITKYFIAASEPNSRDGTIATIAYKGKDNNSRPKYKDSIVPEDTMTHIPITENKPNK